MTYPPASTPRETSRAAVRRITKLLAALAVVATAVFGAAAASATKHQTAGDTSSGDAVSSDIASDSTYDDDPYDGSGFSPPSQGVLPSGDTPIATSGGS